ncbi:hypothetical protein K443DRAFT_337634 [Laccaria amethystina LaAM-08-1]|uniref:Uncharacterized protein n=1 Tax=Laccaria amethystina LaAM-08-1 TaxID=1095629 RepID=A0A0C9X1H1_9AGAR|nr:hypothetical protein K443DRAFT_337634 [Laccaria amethystina LaAM-08-1]
MEFDQNNSSYSTICQRSSLWHASSADILKFTVGLYLDIFSNVVFGIDNEVNEVDPQFHNGPPHPRVVASSSVSHSGGPRDKIFGHTYEDTLGDWLTTLCLPLGGQPWTWQEAQTNSKDIS